MRLPSKSLLVSLSVLALASVGGGCSLFTPAVKTDLKNCQVSSAVAQEGTLAQLAITILTQPAAEAKASAELGALEASGQFAASDVDCMSAVIVDQLEAYPADAGMSTTAVAARVALTKHLASH